MDRNAPQGGQIGLGFGETKPSDRLFFALFPDAAAVVQIEELIGRLRREHGLRAKALRADRFHVTSHFLGDYPRDLWPQIAERASGIVELFPALEAVRFPVWLVTHRELRTSKRIRLVYDILAQELERITREARKSAG